MKMTHRAPPAIDRPKGGFARDARLNGEVRLDSDARVNGDTRLIGDARVNVNMRLDDDARLNDNARSHGDSHFNSDARLNGDARSHGDARLNHNARLHGDAHSHGDSPFIDARLHVLQIHTARVPGTRSGGKRAYRLLPAILMLGLLLSACAQPIRDKELKVTVVNAQGLSAYALDIGTDAEAYDDPEYLVEQPELYAHTRALAAFSRDKLSAAVTCGRIGLSGNLIGEEGEKGTFTHTFTGEAVPNTFYILVESGGMVQVSNRVTTGQRFAGVTYDAGRNVAHVDFSWGDGLIALIVRLSICVAITVLIARWQYGIRRTSAVCGVALVAKLLLCVLCAVIYPYSLFLTVVALLIAELALIPLEYLAYYLVLKEEDASVLRRMVAVTNILCAIVLAGGYFVLR